MFEAIGHGNQLQDEIEYSLLKLDDKEKTVKISLRGPEVMESLRQSEQVIHAFRGCTWHQEYGSWMLEGTPDLPYGGYTMSLASDLDIKKRPASTSPSADPRR